jgi:hypothetical protein
LSETFADLGVAPPADAFVPPERISAMEPFHPLHVLVCTDCRLVQLPAAGPAPPRGRVDVAPGAAWRLRQAEAFAAEMVERFSLDPTTQVTEVASGDGSRLHGFARLGIPALGLEASAAAAQVAIARGIPTELTGFGAATARRLHMAGHEPVLVMAVDVMAQVADLHDLVAGFRGLLAPGGVLVLEVPHVLRLMAHNRIDTIRHGRLSYFSLATAEMALSQHGLVVFDVEEIAAHGGSIRLFARHVEDRGKPLTQAVERLRLLERAGGLMGPDAYRAFAAQVVEIKCALLDFLVGAHRAGKRVAAYGAPARGNTLLNYCGVGPELLAFTVDPSPQRQGMLLPGTRIPVRPPEAIMQERPDFVLILPWNRKDEITAALHPIRQWGGRFVVPFPTVQVF